MYFGPVQAIFGLGYFGIFILIAGIAGLTVPAYRDGGIVAAIFGGLLVTIAAVLYRHLPTEEEFAQQETDKETPPPEGDEKIIRFPER